MTDELKACLRCSSIAVDAWITQELVFRQATIKPHGIVACFDCQTEVNAPTVEMAIKKWNSRPIEDALRAELAQARAELAEMKSANTRTYCAYCGEGILLNEDAPEKVEAHIRACEKHPITWRWQGLRSWKRRMQKLAIGSTKNAIAIGRHPAD
jgi:hypothetical protein